MEPLKNDDIGSLLDQLKNTSIATRGTPDAYADLKKEDVESFVVKQAGILVAESLEIIQDIKERVVAAPAGEDVSALAGLISATSSALETLNKLILADRKHQSAMKLKHLDADIKRQLMVERDQSKRMLTREEMLHHLAQGMIERQTNSTEVSATSIPVNPVE